MTITTIGRNVISQTAFSNRGSLNRYPYLIWPIIKQNGGQTADARRPAVTDVYEFVSDSPLGGGNYGQVRAGCMQSQMHPCA